MSQFLIGEDWKEIKLPHKLKKRYAISNLGRFMSFLNDFKDGTILKGSSVENYKVFRYKLFKNKKISNHHLFFHKLVAEYFIPKPTDGKNYEFVLHLDRNKGNNRVENLRWATNEEMIAFRNKSEKVIEARKKLHEFNRQSDGKKLTSTKVMLIKRKLLDPNRKTRIKILAKQFGVSEMQLYRIKSGENWGHIKVEAPKDKN